VQRTPELANFRPMKSLSWVLMTVVALGAAMAFVWQAKTTEALRGEVVTLREEVRQLEQRVIATKAAAAAPSTLPSADAASATDRAELVRLRQQVSVLDQRTQEIAQAAKSAQQAATSGHAADAAPVKLIPASAWKNAGRATPAAAIETTLWAAAGGDVDAVAAGLALSEAGRREADAMFAQLSDQTRAQYGSPEKLLALMIAKDAGSVTGMQVLGQREISADDVGVRMRFGNDQGQTKEDSFLLHRSADGYQLMLTDAAVKNLARKLSGGK
jgi:hypothetical protein